MKPSNNLTGILLAVSSGLGLSTLALWGKFAVRLGFNSSSLNVYRFLFADLVIAGAWIWSSHTERFAGQIAIVRPLVRLEYMVILRTPVWAPKP